MTASPCACREQLERLALRVHDLEIQTSRFAPERHRIRAVVDFVAHASGHHPHDLCGRDRHHNLVKMRALIILAVREYLDFSYPQIGRVLGGRDHTTIIHLHDRALAWRNTDPEFRTNLELIERFILNGAAIGRFREGCDVLPATT